MSNLKLRFTKPTSLTPPPDAPERMLSSKFSSESLQIKPRLPSLSASRWFTHTPPSPPARPPKSESRLNISTPTMPTRAGDEEEEEEVLEDAGRAKVRVVSSVDEAFAFARHGRTGSGASGKSAEAALGRGSPTPSRRSPRRSVSSPPARPSRPSPPLPDSHLPPRSESRAEHVRPHSPPPADVEPLVVATHPSRAPTPIPAPPTPFHATLVRPPPARAAAAGLDVTLVVLDVGGQRFVTSAQTLVRDGRGGHLGSFVQSSLDSVSPRPDSLSLYPSSETGLDDNGVSFISRTHFDVSPCPSPFQFASWGTDDDELAAAALLLDRNSTLIVPDTPGSPIDPFHSKLFVTIPQRATLTSPSPSQFPSPPARSSPDDWHPSPRSSLYNPFDSALSPFFDILKSQPSTPTSDVPLSPTFFSPEESQSRSTFLGIPRGSRRWVKGPRAMPTIPRLESISSDTSSRPPSLSHSLASSHPDNDDPPLEVFLDRDPTTFVAVLSYLRDRVLPPSLTLPAESERTLFALHPPAALALLAALSTLEREARWLGIDDLVEVCVAERERAGELVSWLEERAKAAKVDEERRRRREMREIRAKAGWI